MVEFEVMEKKYGKAGTSHVPTVRLRIKELEVRLAEAEARGEVFAVSRLRDMLAANRHRLDTLLAPPVERRPRYTTRKNPLRSVRFTL